MRFLIVTALIGITSIHQPQRTTTGFFRCIWYYNTQASTGWFFFPPWCPLSFLASPLFILLNLSRPPCPFSQTRCNRGSTLLNRNCRQRYHVLVDFTTLAAIWAQARRLRTQLLQERSQSPYLIVKKYTSGCCQADPEHNLSGLGMLPFDPPSQPSRPDHQDDSFWARSSCRPFRQKFQERTLID